MKGRRSYAISASPAFAIWTGCVSHAHRQENQADDTKKTFMVMEGISPVNLGSLLRKLSIPRDFDVLNMPQVVNVDLPMLDTLLHGENSPGFMMAEVTDDISPPLQLDFGL